MRLHKNQNNDLKDAKVVPRAEGNCSGGDHSGVLSLQVNLVTLNTVIDPELT